MRVLLRVPRLARRAGVQGARPSPPSVLPRAIPDSVHGFESVSSATRPQPRRRQARLWSTGIAAATLRHVGCAREENAQRRREDSTGSGYRRRAPQPAWTPLLSSPTSTAPPQRQKPSRGEGPRRRCTPAYARHPPHPRADWDRLDTSSASQGRAASTDGSNQRSARRCQLFAVPATS